MELDEECKGCLYNSQLKKVEREQGAGERLEEFRRGVKALCENPPAAYCAPLLMRDIDRLHRAVFGGGIDYSAEKRLFNASFLALEDKLYAEILSSDDPVREALKLAMAANYIDFARIPDLGEGSVPYVIETARRAEPDEEVLKAFKKDLKKAEKLCFLHDNCGEIVADKLLIRAILREYPKLGITSVVRGGEIINDATITDAEQTGLFEYSRVITSGADIPGTYLKEISPAAAEAIFAADIVVSKGLGNLETLYGEGLNAYFCFTCKCAHIAARFKKSVMSAAFVAEGQY